MYEQAVKEWEKAVRLSGEADFAIHLAADYAESGYRRAMRTYVERLLRRQKHEFMSALEVALVCAKLGDNEQALFGLENAVEQRDSFLTLLKVNPRFDGLCSDPRFRNLLPRVGLPPV